ncbi:hypothetical protein HRbin28_01293 [bacterium HR28]|uniref:Uncharacterized protein n=1 Tax=Thermomicrobium roseum TaxID=500 RepID=A0A7C1FT73_THERO|nr:hypothetical protein HRbin28_01293 [bacterium HR28]
MVDVLGPTIRQSTLWRRIQLALLHCGGTVLGGLFCGLLLRWLGQVLLPFELERTAHTWLTVVVLVLALVADLTVGRWRTRSLIHRQVPPRLFARGAACASFAWGLELGIGLSTRWPSLQLVGLAALSLLTGNPLSSALLFGSFGLTRGLATITGAWLLWGRHTSPGATWLIAGQRRLRLLPSLAAVGCITLLVYT